MYAVVKVAGFQYRVEKDQVLRVPLLDVEEGASLNLTDVLLVGDGSHVKVGYPDRRRGRGLRAGGRPRSHEEDGGRKVQAA